MIGSSGMGKTVTLRHVALKMADSGYDVIPVQEPRDIEQYYNPNEKSIFVVDDFCGKYSANKTEIDQWEKIIQNSSRYKLGNVKLFVACRLQVYKDDLFSNLSLFKSCVCDLTEDFKMSEEELQSIAFLYIGENAPKIYEFVNLYDCFPLLCKLYNENKSLRLQGFFQNPFYVFENELDNINSRGFHTKYSDLTLCGMINNKLKKT